LGVCDKVVLMARIDPYEVGDDDSTDERLDVPKSRDDDPVASLRDTDEEAGDEEELDDAYDMDDREAKELGAQLDDRDEPEPRLD
jgi:hypothetical protein